jgi:HAMP domain-containing protein
MLLAAALLVTGASMFVTSLWIEDASRRIDALLDERRRRKEEP